MSCLHLHLATQAPVVGDGLTAEVGRFGGQDLPTTFEHLALAHGAGTTATAGTGQEDLGSLRVLSRVLPASTSMVFSPLMEIFTRPLGESLALA
jgi:hypothetical protein